MPCPWYKDGYCTSPALEHPSKDPVIQDKCLGDELLYKTCKYYREPAARKAGGSLIAKFGRPLLLIHSISVKPSSGCEFFKVEKHETGSYLAACEVLGRYLTRYEVSLCEKKWVECPYRKVGQVLKGEGRR